MAHLFQRGKTYYLKYYVGGKQKMLSLRTTSLQIAKEKHRQFESAQARGQDNPLPSRTPIPEILDDYVRHIRATKTAKAAQNDVYYLREAFGPCCGGLRITSRTPSAKTRRLRSESCLDRRRKLPVIEAACFEVITPAQIADFVSFKVQDQGIKPKTANHYRSILRRVFNWAVQERGVRLPDGINPAARVKPYKESAPEIRFLTLKQVEEQLEAIRFQVQLQAMVAVLIYAGLRREELLWLTHDDIDLRRLRGGGYGVIRVRAKTLYGRSWQPKTKVNRAVPVSRKLRQHLDGYATMAGHPVWFFPPPAACPAGNDATEHVDADTTAGRDPGPWDPDNFSRDLRRANKDAGLKWSCLDFRHTFGSQLAQNGVSLYKIATLMGNSPEVCRRHYAALLPECLAAEVEFDTGCSRRVAGERSA